jgi:hypothetical protein
LLKATMLVEVTKLIGVPALTSKAVFSLHVKVILVQ